MGKLNLRFLKDKFIHILPVENTYLVVSNVSEKVNFTKQLVRLNYSHLSIFKDGDFVFLKDSNKLLIWFTEHKLEKKIYIPEAFFIFETYKNRKNAIIVKDTADKRCILVIKDGLLKTQFCKKGLDKQYLELIKREYSLESPSIIEINNELKLKTSIDSIIKFSKSIEIDIKFILASIYEGIKVPIIIALFLIDVFGFFMYGYVGAKIRKDKNEIILLKHSNSQMKEKFERLQLNSAFYNKFIESELEYPNMYETLSIITKIMLKNKSKINTYRQYENVVEIGIVSLSTSSIAESLLATNYFANVQILSTTQYYKDKTQELGRLKLTLKRKVKKYE